MKKIIIPLLILMILILFSLYVKNGGIGEEKISVATSFYPLEYIAKEVGGERAEVMNTTPPGMDPHDFEPSPRTIASLQNKDLFLYMGEGLEPWAERTHSDLENAGVRVVKMSRHLDLMRGDHYHNNDHHHHDKDPHTWLDPLLYKKKVELVRDNFTEIDEEGEEEYTRNAQEMMERLEVLHSHYEEGLSDCARDHVVISHASISYLAERYSFHMVPVLGISPKEEPSPRKMAEISDLVREEGIEHIFFETAIPETLSATIAAETGAETLVFHPLGTLTREEMERGEDYFSVMESNLEKLRKVLLCQ